MVLTPQPAGFPGSPSGSTVEWQRERRLLVPLLLSILLHLIALTTVRQEWWQNPAPMEEDWIEVIPAPEPRRPLPIVETPDLPESPPPVEPDARAERDLRKEGTGEPTTSPLEGEVEVIPLAPPAADATPAPVEAAPEPADQVQPVQPPKVESPPQLPPPHKIEPQGELLPAPTHEPSPGQGERPTPRLEEIMPPPQPPAPKDSTALPRGAELVPSFDSPVYAPYMAPRPGARAEHAYPGRRNIPLDTRDDRFVSYFLKIKRQIEYIWDYPRAAAARGEHGDAVIQFTILKDGRVKEIKLLRSSGHPILDNEALTAIRDGAPYPPIPRRLNTDELTVTGTFRYLLSRFRPFIR